MKKEFIEKIAEIKANELQKIANISLSTTHKYKSSLVLPSLEKAVLIEDELQIPARTWVDMKIKKEVIE